MENRHVLDRIETPDGAIELVAYREGGEFWVGLARPEGETLGATAPRSGSVAPRVAGAVKWFGSWGLGWGVVGPRIVRAEWRNDSGESFPAKIVPLPSDLDPEYRAVWGMIGALPMESCDLLGHDDRGLAYDESDGGRTTGTKKLRHVAREIGARWAAESPASSPLEGLEATLSAHGYEPYWDRPNKMRLRNCPFEALIPEHENVVCKVLNLALMKGLVGGLGAQRVSAVYAASPPLCCVSLRVGPERGKEG